MNENKKDIKLDPYQIRTIILYEYLQNTTQTDVLDKLSTYFPGQTSKSSIQRMFSKFKNGIFDVQDEQRSGRPIKINNDELNNYVKNKKICIEEISEYFNVCRKTIRNHLHQIGYAPKYQKWVPHILDHWQKRQRIRICENNLNWYSKDDSILDRIVTMDEKWIYFANEGRKLVWLREGETAEEIGKKIAVTKKKVMLSVWWSAKGIVHLDFTTPGYAISSDDYCNQLDEVNNKLRGFFSSDLRRKGIIYHHDNAPCHTARKSKEKLECLGWNILQHPPHSPDIAPSDFYLFFHLQNYLNNNNCKFDNSRQACSAVKEWFDGKDLNFYKRGIYKLPERWQEIIDLEGNYLPN